MVLILHTLHLTTLLIYNYAPVGILCSTFSRTKRFRNAFEVWYIFFLTWAQSQINLLEARFKNKFVGTSLGPSLLAQKSFPNMICIIALKDHDQLTID